MYFKSVGGQFPRNDIGRPFFLEGEFRVGVDIAPNFGELGNERYGQKIHGVRFQRADFLVYACLSLLWTLRPLFIPEVSSRLASSSRFRYARVHGYRNH